MVADALIAAVPATIAGLAAWRASRATHDEVRTNHGVRAGERIEALGDDVLWLKEHVVTKNELADHARSDLNFQRRIERALNMTPEEVSN